MYFALRYNHEPVGIRELNKHGLHRLLYLNTYIPIGGIVGKDGLDGGGAFLESGHWDRPRSSVAASCLQVSL